MIFSIFKGPAYQKNDNNDITTFPHYNINMDDLLIEAGICPCCGKVPNGSRLDRIRHRMRNKLDLHQKIYEELVYNSDNSESSEEDCSENAVNENETKGKHNRKNMKRKTKKKEDKYIKKFMDTLNNCPIVQKKIILCEDTRSKIITMCQTYMGKEHSNDERTIGNQA